MRDEEDIKIMEKYLKNKEMFRDKKSKHMFSIGILEIEAIESLMGKYKCYRGRLNDAFDNGFVHKDEVKEILKKQDKILRLIVEDFQDEGYFKNMKYEQVIEFYKSRIRKEDKK